MGFQKGGAKTEIARMPVHFARMADYFSHIFSEVMVKGDICGRKKMHPLSDLLLTKTYRHPNAQKNSIENN